MMNKSDIVKQDMDAFRDEITRLRDATADALCRATETLHQVVFEAISEVDRATASWPPFNSAHEAYAVLAEEVDELWDHVKTNQKRRNLEAMRAEAIQVAAMAIRFASEVCSEERGRK